MKHDKDTVTLHSFLNIHEWEYVDAAEISAHEKAVSNQRRMCVGCGRIEWTYGNDATYEPNGRSDDDWYEDRSALAAKHVVAILKARHDKG